MSETVNHPRHYSTHKKGIECIGVVRLQPFNTGNSLKYVWRHQFKGHPLVDLKKAIWYINDELAQLEKTSWLDKCLFFLSRLFFMPTLPHSIPDIVSPFHPVLAAGITALLEADFTAETVEKRARNLRVALDLIGMYAEWVEGLDKSSLDYIALFGKEEHGQPA